MFQHPTLRSEKGRGRQSEGKKKGKRKGEKARSKKNCGKKSETEGGRYKEKG
jgi:hypothetical protein